MGGSAYDGVRLNSRLKFVNMNRILVKVSLGNDI